MHTVYLTTEDKNNVLMLLYVVVTRISIFYIKLILCLTILGILQNNTIPLLKKILSNLLLVHTLDSEDTRPP